MFPLGQQIRLNSGGPVMTVIGHSPNGRVWCQWHKGDEVDEASFFPEMLVAVSFAPGAA